MGKVKIFVLVILFCAMAVPVSAQFKYGLKAGMSMNTVHFNKDRLDPESAIGYYAGPTMEWITSFYNVGFDLSFLFSQRGLAYHDKRYTQNYMDIPLNLKWKAGLPFGQVYVAAGPYYAIRLGEKTWSIPKTVGTSSNMRVTPRSKDAGISIGAGVHVLKYFQIGVSYRYGLADAYEVYTSNTTYAQNRSWEINLGVLF